jgi:S-formylglutathione hydrolase FrmB
MGGYGAMRYALAYPELFSAAIVLSPATYVPLPPVDSSARTFGAFGVGDKAFVEDVYIAKNYPALLAGFAARNLASHFFVGSGDDEYKNPPPDQAHDIDLEAHVLFSKLVRTPHITAELRIVNGSHDWPAWDPLFREGVIDIFTRLDPAGDAKVR